MPRAVTRPAPKREPLYYSKDADDLLLRRTDGDPTQPPDEHLTRSGWKAYPWPVEWARLSFESEASAREIARANEWPEW